MQSEIIALLVPEGGRKATLLVRRGDGQFALNGIDARLASATQNAAGWFRQSASAGTDCSSQSIRLRNGGTGGH